MRKLLFRMWVLFLNHKIEASLTATVYKAISLIENCPSVKVEITYHNIKIQTSSTTINFWNANKFYAWLQSGDINGVRYRGISPSRSAMFDFKECLKKRGYNIYVPEHTDHIPSNVINQIRC